MSLTLPRNRTVGLRGQLTARHALWWEKVDLGVWSAVLVVHGLLLSHEALPKLRPLLSTHLV